MLAGMPIFDILLAGTVLILIHSLQCATGSDGIELMQSHP